MRSSSRKDAADVVRHELIGLRVTVESPDKGVDGLEGLVIDETMQTLLVESPDGIERRVPKPGARFVFEVGGESIVVRGTDIRFRPEDRTKRARV